MEKQDKVGPLKIYKRDGKLVNFDPQRIVNAIYKAFQASREGSLEKAHEIAHSVIKQLEQIKLHHKTFIPNVEGIQDDIEEKLALAGFFNTARTYIKYREERTKKRMLIPENVRKLAEESKQYFRNTLSEFVYLRTYARWIEKENRRETWIETVDRYVGFMKENLGKKLSNKQYTEIRNAILKQEVMPSMRLLQFSGKAARKTHVCAYNCSFIAPTKIKDLGEIMYICMCGTGVGFSIESQNVQALPQVKLQTGENLGTHSILDSKEGWCDALVLGMNTWYAGKDLQFDYSQLRPVGARLKTMGGKSSGPDPLRSLLDFTRQKILQRQGRRLANLDLHDIICKIGEIVVSGGVRRSAMISLSDLDDSEMRDAKKGAFYQTEPQRSLANNSSVYTEKPSNKALMDEWVALMHSGTGERGIFNRGGLISSLPERRIKFFKKQGLINGDRITGIIGTNPCGEIVLQSKQFCNLSEVIARAEDTETTLRHKIRIATLIGTYQASLTNFPYLSKEWKKNCESERLLGVSITGQWDCKNMRNPSTLKKLKNEAIKANKRYAKQLGIQESTCITCVKPSGTVSQAVDSASGMHPRYSQYYVRRVRIAATDSLFKMLKNQGVPYFPEIGQTWEEANTFVLEFPVEAPRGAVFKDDLSALDQLAYWKMVKENYTEHNPSVTISVGEDEWINVVNWLYEHWDIVGGLSFLPRFDHVYQLAPYETISKQDYEKLSEKIKNIDFSKLVAYERKDETEVKKEIACAGGACDII